MDYDDDPDVAERDPTGQYVRYNEILGRGAFKTVYKGFDEGNGIEVAWNQMRLDEVMHSQEQLERLYAEVHLVKSLKHENIIKSHHSWVDDKNMAINMITELFTSGSLRQYRKKHNKVDMKAIKNWARQILGGLKYLHTQKPPIMHRDLKCDNIFVNGHTGKVKIGDLGLAAVMQLPTAHSVIGTPEFMAPELYDEEYNELVDIYSFGMCMLEMITCEYPYSECKNPAQIYKKVTNGVKPASLARLTDPQAKHFIERCLAPVSMRVPADELLNDPFLVSTNSGGTVCISLPLSSCKSESKCVMMSEYHPMDVDVDHKKSSSSLSSQGSTEAEVTKVNKINSFRLRGKLGEDDSVSMSLRITDMYGQARNIHFPFYLHTDTTLSIAGEMVQDLELPNEDAVSIAELMDDLIKKLAPGSGVSSSATASEGGAGSLVEDSLIAHDDANSVRCPSSPDSPMDSAKSMDGQQDLSKPRGDDDAQVLANCISTISSEFSGLGSSFEDKLSLSAMSFLTLPVECSELELQIDAIESKYRQCCEELFKLREEAIADAMRRYSMKKISVV